jgi:hypothetical protein
MSRLVARCRMPVRAIAQDKEIKALRASLPYLRKKDKKISLSMKRCDSFLHYADRMNGKSTN